MPSQKDPYSDVIVVPFIVVKHGDPEPVEWLARHPGADKIPATFVPRGAHSSETDAGMIRLAGTVPDVSRSRDVTAIDPGPAGIQRRVQPSGGRFAPITEVKPRSLPPVPGPLHRQAEMDVSALSVSSMPCQLVLPVFPGSSPPRGIHPDACGRLWAIQPTADDYARHYMDKTGKTVYRMGSDVSLKAYGKAALVYSRAGAPYYKTSALVLAEALLAWERSKLKPGALTDTFIYGSLNKVKIIDWRWVQLSFDVFNYDPERDRWIRNALTWIQHKTLGRGKPGKDFATVFVGLTKAP